VFSAQGTLERPLDVASSGGVSERLDGLEGYDLIQTA
jgi:hypothetical protein